MVNWQPGASLATLRQRAKTLSTVRKFFADRDILEIEGDESWNKRLKNIKNYEKH